MKCFLLSNLLLFCITIKAQVPKGDLAPDFTLTDINGVSHNLYTYLNEGKTVFLDISATWCGPCFDYHKSHVLENLWIEHGPTGGTNVSLSTTNDVIVLFVEGDEATDSDDLHGINSALTLGDWVTGVSHPIIDPVADLIKAFNLDYKVVSFPSIYKICPNRRVTEVDRTMSAEQLYATVDYCELTTAFIDVIALPYRGKTKYCSGSDYVPEVRIFNNSTETLNNATITILQNGKTISSAVYSGSLASLESTTVICSSIAGFSAAFGELTIKVTTPNDVNEINGQLTVSVSESIVTTNKILLDIKTDFSAWETYWVFLTEDGTIVQDTEVEPYSLEDNTLYSKTYTLPSVGCYRFKISDVKSDGITNGPQTDDFGTQQVAEGEVQVRDNEGHYIMNNIDFREGADIIFKVNSIVSILESEKLDAIEFNVYPNPFSDVLHLRFIADNCDYIFSISDLTGRIVNTKKLNNLNGFQNIEIPIVGLSKGNYFVTIANNESNSIQQVVVE